MRKFGLALVVTLAMSISRAALPQQAQATVPKKAIPANDLETPITLLYSKNTQLTDGQRQKIYADAAKFYLAKTEKFHPDLLDFFRDFLLSPLPNHDGKSAGFLVFQEGIDYAVDQSRITGVDPDKVDNAYSVVARVAQVHYNNWLKDRSKPNP
jgi:hypothetical protein